MTQIEIDGDQAKVSEYVTVKIGIPDTYSSVEVNFGHSRTCPNTAVAIRQMATRIHNLNLKIIEERIQEVVEIAKEAIDNV